MLNLFFLCLFRPVAIVEPKMGINKRKVIINAKVKSMIDYGVPLFLGESQSTIQKVEAIYMTINRIIQGGLNFRTNSENMQRDKRRHTWTKLMQNCS